MQRKQSGNPRRQPGTGVKTQTGSSKPGEAAATTAPTEAPKTPGPLTPDQIERMRRRFGW